MHPINNIEVELKFRLSLVQLETIVDQLQKSGFDTKNGRLYEKTSMYDNRDFLMQKTNGRVRLRISGEHYELCYKKPIINNSGIKKEIEYETSIGDPHLANKILNAMDYFEVSSYERFRTSYRNEDRSIMVTIDEFPFDVFLEIEGEEDEIVSLASELGFEMKDNLTEPCDTLFNIWRKARGLGEKMIMSFEGYDKE